MKLCVPMILAGFLVIDTLGQFAGLSCKGVTRGRQFAIAFTSNNMEGPRADEAEIILNIIAFSNNPTMITISSKHVVNGRSFQTTFEIEPMGFRRIQIPIELRLGAISERSKKILIVDATSDVSVYGLNYEPFTTDAFLAIPTNFLGVFHVAISYVNDGNDGPTLFAVLAIEDYTDVLVTLSARVTFNGETYLAGSVLTFTLRKHEVVQIVADSSDDYLGGSIIQSSESVAVFSGTKCASTAGSYCDILSEQILPVKSWGKTHIYTATGSSQDKSIYTIQSFYENTTVQIPGINEIILEPGDVFQSELIGSGIISSNQPITVIQLLRTIKGRTVDPSIIQIPAEEQFGYIFGFSTPPKSGADGSGFFNFINIVVKINETRTLLLNNMFINTTIHTKTYIPNTDYEVLIIEVEKGEGLYFVEQSLSQGSSPIAVTVYGYGEDESYGYAAGLLLPSDERLLNIKPFFLQEVGGERVVITLPCLDNNVFSTSFGFCRFKTTNGYIDVKATFSKIYEVSCITPIFGEVGRTVIEVSIDNKKSFPFRGIVYVALHDLLPPKLEIQQGELTKEFVDLLMPSPIELRWNSEDLMATTVDISVQIAVTGTELGNWSSQIVIANDELNNGYFSINPVEKKMSAAIRKIQQFGLSSVIFRVEKSKTLNGLMEPEEEEMEEPAVHIISSRILKLIGETTCSDWISELQSGSTAGIIPCPCTNNQASSDSNFELDASSDLDYFHPGASSCFRSSAGSSSAGQQCCYDAGGIIIVGPPGGGTADAFTPGGFLYIGTLKHFIYDVLPWVACCKLNDECNTYYNYRPSDDCSNYIPPRPTRGTGDPHSISIDGKEFTFNGVGEFLLLKSPKYNLTLQARTEMLYGTNASVYTAFVLSSNNSVPIQVQRNSTNETVVLINGTQMNVLHNGFMIRKQEYDGVRVELNSDLSEIAIRHFTGVSIDIRITSEMMSFILQVPDVFKGDVEGLLGNFNDDPDDDFMLPNKSFLSPNLTLQEIHYNFGLSWIVKENESVFTYLRPYDFWTYYKPSFTPILQFPGMDEVREDIKDLCGTSIPCLFDAIATNSTTFANDTLHDVQMFEYVSEVLVKIVSCGYPGKVDNGYINGSVYFSGSTIDITCRSGYTLKGSSSITCSAAGRWSDELPGCMSKCENCNKPSLLIWLFICIFCIILVCILAAVIYYFGKSKCRKNTTV